MPSAPALGSAIPNVAAPSSPDDGSALSPSGFPAQAQPGFHPPQQARSRAALQRLLAAAEQVLINDGPEDFTIARVAEHAGISVGGVYRRFGSKEQLIAAIRLAIKERLEHAVSEALGKAEPSLGGVIAAFTTALSDILDQSGRVIPAILAGGKSVDPRQAPQAITNLQQQFVDAVAPFRGQIRHRNPVTALNMVFRSVIAAGAHRAAISPWVPDDLTWAQWASEISDMATAYLTVEGRNTAPATGPVELRCGGAR